MQDTVTPAGFEPIAALRTSPFLDQVGPFFFRRSGPAVVLGLRVGPAHTNARVLAELRQGRPVILVDDEDRENEGDLVCAAETVTPEIINFMTRHTPGYLCVTMTAADCDRLELHPQAVTNTALRGTAMTVSVDG